MTEADSEIVRLLLNANDSDPDSIVRLLEPFRNYLRLLARLQLRPSIQNKVDASDIAQDTIIKALERFKQFRGKTEAELAGWLRQILSRRLADLGRYYNADVRNIGHEKSVQASVDATSLQLGGMLPGHDESPSDVAKRGELGIVLADALSSLGEEHRDVIVMRNLEDRDWPEIAETMSRSEAAVRMLWTRALQKLRPLVEERI
jgi:RNA polymerase sigma-70 factor (ECF subfamily)